MTEVLATLVVVPRERFSYTSQSLESIYQNTTLPFKLVYIDGNSPEKVKRYLQAQAQERGFKLIRTNHFLTPNQARNLSLPHIDTQYVVFIENDVLVTPFWLERLVNCAEETGAWLVGPLTCEGEDFATIHFMGGSIKVTEEQGKRRIVCRRPYMYNPLAKVESSLKREPTQLLEFHSMLVRRELFDQLGGFDEALLGTADEDDFCLTVLQAGKLIYFEPASRISFIVPNPPALSDLPFFFSRWSHAWCETSVDRFIQKWNLSEDSPSLKHIRVFSETRPRLAYPKSKPTYQKILPFLKYLMVRSFMGAIESFINWRISYR